MQALHHPRALVPGDRVAVVSPAGPVIPSLLEDGLRTLRGWGLEPVVPEQCYARRAGADYLAGDDRERLAALHAAFTDPEIAAIVCSRGGYGTMRLLPLLDAGLIRRHPKLLVGFSDITALHLYLAGVLGVATLHGPVVKSFHLHREDPHDSLEHLRAALFGQRRVPLAVEGLRTVRPGRARGRLLGGNLSLIANVLASPYCPDLSDAIVVLEEVGECDYRLDRLFTTLRLSERGHGLRGLVLGDFTDCSGAYVSEGAMQGFVEMLAGEFDCPVVSDFPGGHGTRNIALPMGVDAELDADRGTLTILQDAVATPP